MSTISVNIDQAYIEDGVLHNASITRRVTFVSKDERQDAEKGPDFNRDIALQVTTDSKGIDLETVLEELHKSETIGLRGYFRPKYDSDFCTRFFDEQAVEQYDGQELPLLSWHPDKDKGEFFSMPKSTSEWADMMDGEMSTSEMIEVAKELGMLEELKMKLGL